MQDEVAVVGEVQGAGADHGEVGGHGAEARLIVQAAEEVVVGGLLLVDDGGVLGGLFAVADEEVDFIAAEDRVAGVTGGAGCEWGAALCAVLGGGGVAALEGGDVVQDVFSDGGEVTDEFVLGVLLAQFLQDRAGDVARGFAVQFPDGFAGADFQLAQVAHGAIGGVLDAASALFEVGADVFRQLLEDLRGDGLAVLAARDADEAAGGEGDEEALLGAFLLQGFDDLLALLHDVLQGLGSALVVGLVVEDGGEFGAQAFDEAGEVTLEVVAGGRGEGYGAGAVGVFKVVEVAPVAHGRVAFGGGVDEDADGGVASGGAWSGDGDVVAVRLDFEPEADGLQSALLSGDAVQGFDLRGGGGDEGVLVLRAEFVGAEFVLTVGGGGHGAPAASAWGWGIRTGGPGPRFTRRRGAPWRCFADGWPSVQCRTAGAGSISGGRGGLDGMGRGVWVSASGVAPLPMGGGWSAARVVGRWGSQPLGAQVVGAQVTGVRGKSMGRPSRALCSMARVTSRTVQACSAVAMGVSRPVVMCSSQLRVSSRMGPQN